MESLIKYGQGIVGITHKLDSKAMLSLATRAQVIGKLNQDAEEFLNSVGEKDRMKRTEDIRVPKQLIADMMSELSAMESLLIILSHGTDSIEDIDEGLYIIPKNIHEFRKNLNNRRESNEREG